ncbi:Auxin response factor 2B [Camellia lanceoleosa]|uniref:Auxin response factor 2B n=1 Tax=Camellia lanceoleosa TaxID=1840588 RepID=A0ACC0IJ12_9ERIC|nr:Auxin response factor 2B [Camellia lanceoleosa]
MEPVLATWHFVSPDPPLADGSVIATNPSSFRDTLQLAPMPDSYDLDRGLLLAVQAIQATPLLLTVAVIELSDIAFTVDSIPAVFGVTRDPSVVFTSNFFAILEDKSAEFIILYDRYMKSPKMTIQLEQDSRCFDGEECPEQKCSIFAGTVVGINNIDCIRWPGSEWRCLKVQWDAPSKKIVRPQRISHWNIEPEEVKKKCSSIVTDRKRERPLDPSTPGFTVLVSEGDRLDDGTYRSIVMETANPYVGTAMAAAVVKNSVVEDRPLVHTNSLADHDQPGPVSTRPRSQPVVHKGTRRGMPTKAQVQTFTGSRAHEAIGSVRGSKGGTYVRRRTNSKNGRPSPMATWHKGPAFKVAASVLSHSRSIGQGLAKEKELIDEAKETIKLGKVLGIDFLGSEEEAL